MALDLGKKISLDLLTKRGRNKVEYPTKRTMNLYQVEGSGAVRRRVIVTAVGIAVAAILFLNFAVFAPLANVAKKQSELAKVRADLEPVQQRVQEYDDILSEYEAYAPISSSSGVDAMGVLDMVESKVRPNCTVNQVSLEDAKLTITLSNVSLESVGSIAKELGQQEGVDSVSVSTAQSSDESTGVVATVTVRLKASGSSNETGEK